MTQNLIFARKWAKLNYFITFELMSKVGHLCRGQTISIRLQNGVQTTAFRLQGKWRENALTLAPCIIKKNLGNSMIHFETKT